MEDQSGDGVAMWNGIFWNKGSIVHSECGGSGKNITERETHDPEEGKETKGDG